MSHFIERSHHEIIKSVFWVKVGFRVGVKLLETKLFRVVLLLFLDLFFSLLKLRGLGNYQIISMADAGVKVAERADYEFCSIFVDSHSFTKSLGTFIVTTPSSYLPI